MSNGDQILRAYAAITSLKANVPNDYEIEETWVRQFNDALTKVEAALATDLAEFKVPKEALYRSVASSNYVTEEVNYREGLWCRREVLLQKIDAGLAYFTGVQGGQDKRIGFQKS